MQCQVPICERVPTSQTCKTPNHTSFFDHRNTYRLILNAVEFYDTELIILSHTKSHILHLAQKILYILHATGLRCRLDMTMSYTSISLHHLLSRTFIRPLSLRMTEEMAIGLHAVFFYPQILFITRAPSLYNQYIQNV